MKARTPVGGKAWLWCEHVGYQWNWEWNDIKRQTVLKYSCCDLRWGTLIWLKATPSFMLQRKCLCQAQAENNGGQPWGNRAICMQLFAVSTTTKANQRNLNGGWQASTNAFALRLCQPSPLCLPSKKWPTFFFLLLFLKTDQTFHRSFLPFSPTVSYPEAVESAGLKGWSARLRNKRSEQQRST